MGYLGIGRYSRIFCGGRGSTEPSATVDRLRRSCTGEYQPLDNGAVGRDSVNRKRGNSSVRRTANDADNFTRGSGTTSAGSIRASELDPEHSPGDGSFIPVELCDNRWDGWIELCCSSEWPFQGQAH